MKYFPVSVISIIQNYPELICNGRDTSMCIVNNNRTDINLTSTNAKDRSSIKQLVDIYDADLFTRLIIWITRVVRYLKPERLSLLDDLL